jgi:RNA polymerase sigma-70 factor, ECF subfamily
MSLSSNNESQTDRDLFVRLIMRHDRAVRAYLRSMLPTSLDVDEVMQEAAVVAWRKFDELDDPEIFGRWLCVIARYEALMHRRKKARDRLFLCEDIEQLLADEGLEELELREQQLEALEACLKKLPEDRRRLVLHVYATDHPMKTVAKAIGKTPESLYKFLSRARRQLHRCVEQTLAEAES